MKLTKALSRNLNVSEWNRRVWEIGYRGPPLPKHKITGKPNWRVRDNAIIMMQERFKREFAVMKCLASPYMTKEQEAIYIEKHGSFAEQREKERAEIEQCRMPGEPKRMTVMGKVLKAKANIGNSLHTHRTVEDSMKEMIVRKRWD